MNISAHKNRLAFSANSTATAFGTLVPTTTKPSGDGVIDMLAESIGWGMGVFVPKFLFVQFLGSDANNETYSAKLTGWSPDNQATPIWTPIEIGLFAVTLGNIAATAYGTNNFLADTIVLTRGDANMDIISPANDEPASLILHTRGCQLLQFEFNTDAVATDMNALIRPIFHP
jgi:hypothetical protein